jgi:phage terminase small subunit
MRQLSQREAAFAVHFTTIGSDTFSDGKKSAVAAGYSDRSAHVAASRLLKRDKVRNRISELHSENMQRNLITTDKVLADLEHDKVMARKHNQYSVAKGCTELQGKYLAMFTDRLQTEPEEHRPLSAEEEAAARDYASFRMSREYPDMAAWALSQARMAANAEQWDSADGHEFKAISGTGQEGTNESLQNARKRLKARLS